jgi:hypothetical protein
MSKHKRETRRAQAKRGSDALEQFPDNAQVSCDTLEFHHLADPPRALVRLESSSYTPIDSFWSSWRWRGGGRWEREFGIELKPVVGDDYPAVLRQMKRNGSRVLFVGAYTGQGATEAQFVKTMATAGIRVVFARDVED